MTTTETDRILRLQENRNRRRNRILALIGVMSILGAAMVVMPY